MLIFVFALILVNSEWQTLSERVLLLCALPVGPFRPPKFSVSMARMLQ